MQFDTLSVRAETGEHKHETRKVLVHAVVVFLSARIMFLFFNQGGNKLKLKPARAQKSCRGPWHLTELAGPQLSKG